MLGRCRNNNEVKSKYVWKKVKGMMKKDEEGKKGKFINLVLNIFTWVLSFLVGKLSLWLSERI